MTIFIDVSAAVHRRAGLGRYAENLARALIASDSEHYGLFYNNEKRVNPLSGLESLPTRTVALDYKPWRLIVWLACLTRIGFDRLLPEAELFHATEHLLLPLNSIPRVMTVHDLIFRHLPEHHKPLNRWYLNLAMPLYCRQADHIIAVSECTRQDLITSYNIPSDKVTVIHEAADDRFRPQSEEVVDIVRRHYGLPEQYLLFVGTIEPRKNLGRLLKAFEQLHRDHLTDGLVIVGKQGWLYDSFFAALESSPAREAVMLPGYIPDADLPAVYAAAQAFVFPSLYEGFGLPVLEAMACGTPVACSNSSSLPEVSGQAALHFESGDVQSIVTVVRKLLTDADLSDELKLRGLEQAARFSWKKVASKTSSVYNTLLRTTT